MPKSRDLVQPAVLLIAAMATIAPADAKPSHKVATSTEVARSEIEPADGGYIIVTAPRRAISPRRTATVPVGATVRIDETAVRRTAAPARSAKR